MRVGDLGERVDDGQPGVAQVAPGHLSARTPGKIVLGAVLPREEARCEREVREHSQVVLGRELLQRGLVGLPVHQVVVRLQRDGLVEALTIGDVEPGLCALRGVVRDADVADLAGLHQGIERGDSLLERGVLVVEMRVVQVDVVALQARQRRIRRGRDGRGGQTAEVGMLTHLGREDDVVSSAGPGEPVADDGFGFAARIARCERRIRVGGVDQRPTGTEERLDDVVRRGFVGGPPEGVGAERKRENIQVRVSDASHTGNNPSAARTVPASGRHADPDAAEGVRAEPLDLGV